MATKETVTKVKLTKEQKAVRLAEAAPKLLASLKKMTALVATHPLTDDEAKIVKSAGRLVDSLK